ncbi:MAG TPA: helix-hairpin-helix domain-containing protein, partial [Gemmatimonadota bacterium]|nr:helix-hairpin-helix domain-containing protein [Gemmatimonadota bacterium]
MTEGEARALLASAVLVLLATLGRVLLAPPAARVRAQGLPAAGVADSALAVAESVYTETERRRRPLAPDERIDPNSADEAELDRLPGVGPVLARSIIRHRRVEGPFGSLEDLERVPGLGSSKVGRLAPFIGLRAASGPQGPPAEAGSGSGAGPVAVDLNRASPEELQAVPGIG